ncbi:TPA: YSIRK-type signal peptide-containing protein [Staphylococcus aureus]
MLTYIYYKRNEGFYEIIKSHQSFSIRKHSLGVGSILIGIGLSFSVFATETKGFCCKVRNIV